MERQGSHLGEEETPRPHEQFPSQLLVERRGSRLGNEDTPRHHEQSATQVVVVERRSSRLGDGERLERGRSTSLPVVDRRGSRLGEGETPRHHERHSSQVVGERRGSRLSDEEMPRYHGRLISRSSQSQLELERRGSHLGDEDTTGHARSSSQVGVEMVSGVRERASSNPRQAYLEARQKEKEAYLQARQKEKEEQEEKEASLMMSPPPPYGGEDEEGGGEVLSPSRITLADRLAFNNPYAPVQVRRRRGDRQPKGSMAIGELGEVWEGGGEGGGGVSLQKLLGI